MKKAGEFLKKIYGYGIVAVLFIGGFTVVGYIAAMIIGGDTAAAICYFIYKKLFLWLIIGADIVVLLGLVSMYLTKEKSMNLEKHKSKKN